MKIKNKFEYGDIVTHKESDQRMDVIKNNRLEDGSIDVVVYWYDNHDKFCSERFNQDNLIKVNKFNEDDIVTLKGSDQKLMVVYNYYNDNGDIFARCVWDDVDNTTRSEDFNQDELEK